MSNGEFCWIGLRGCQAYKEWKGKRVEYEKGRYGKVETVDQYGVWLLLVREDVQDGEQTKVAVYHKNVKEI